VRALSGDVLQRRCDVLDNLYSSVQSVKSVNFLALKDAKTWLRGTQYNLRSAGHGEMSHGGVLADSGEIRNSRAMVDDL
jgi:hypothetical protein